MHTKYVVRHHLLDKMINFSSILKMAPYCNSQTNQSSRNNIRKYNNRRVIPFQTVDDDVYSQRAMQQTTNIPDLRLKIEKSKHKRDMQKKANLPDLRLKIQILRNTAEHIQPKANLPDLRSTIKVLNNNREPSAQTRHQEIKQQNQQATSSTAANTKFFSHRTSNYKSQSKIGVTIEKQRQKMKTARTNKKFDRLNAKRTGISALLRADETHYDVHPEFIPLPQDEEFDAVNNDIILSQMMASLTLNDDTSVNDVHFLLLSHLMTSLSLSDNAN